MDKYPVLCGGTLLSLIWASIKDEISDKDNPEKKKAPNYIEFYKELITCVGAESDASFNTLKTNLSRYKNCKLNDGKGLGITSAAFRENFEHDFKVNSRVYSTHLKEFLDRYIDEKNANLLLWRLIALIEADESIKPGELRKGSFLERTKPVQLPNLLMNTLRFIILSRPDNMSGADTLHELFSKEYSNAQGQFNGSLDVEPFKHLRVAVKETDENLDYLFDFEYHAADPVFDYQYADNPAGYWCDTEALPYGLTTYYESEPEEPKNPIQQYLEKAKKRYFTAKTLLYLHSPMPFYDFYETADIKKAGSKNNPVISGLDAMKLQELDQYMVIYGTGGLGKSMMLRHLFLSSVDQFNEIRKLPVLISLKDYKDPAEKLLSFCYHQIDTISSIEYDSFIEMLEAGRIVFFFDGYDELKSTFKEKFDLQLNEMITRYPDDRYVMSSRPMSSFVQLEKFSLYNLMPLTQQQAVQMIQRQKYDPEVKERLILELKTGLYETHKAFIENPLLLMILLITYNVHGKLPTSRSEFYEKVFNALLFEHDGHKSGFNRQWQTRLSEKEFREMFTLFCMQTYSEEEYEFSEASFLDTAEYVQEKCSLKHKVEPESFLKDCVDNLCLIVKDGQTYHFIHRTFQEFFAGVFLAEQTDEDCLYGAMRNISNNHEGSALNVFRFAHELNYKKIEKYGFIPYLQEFLDGTEYENGYEDFLVDLFPVIGFSVGETESDYGTKPSVRPIYGLIREVIRVPEKIYSDKDEIGEDDELPFHEDFVDETYGYYSFLNSEYDLDRDFGIIEDGQHDSYQDLEIVGHTISIDTGKVLKYPSRYPAIKDAFYDDDFKPREEFFAAKDYLRRLKSNYSRSRSILLESRKKK